MTRWYALQPTDESIFTTAPQVFRFPVELPVSPERVWESLASDESLGAWGLGVSVRWTSPRPFGVGTGREVTLPLHLMTVRERFFIWDEGKRYSFVVEEANRPGLLRFAEDYVVEATPTGSRFTWTIAIEPAPRLGRVIGLAGPVNRFAFSQTTKAAKRYFAKHPT